MYRLEKITWLVLLLLLGCNTTPTVSVRHMSDPGIEHDGYDMGCLGLKTRQRLNVKAGWCWNARGGDMVDIEIEYELRK